MSDVPYGCFLSGGIDSAGIAAAMAGVDGTPPRSFTIGFPGHGSDLDERAAAAETARIIGTDHSAVAMSLSGFRGQLNTWRRQLAGTSGHAEGWALYAERLMEQLGYLDDPADRLGMLDGQRMRASRVVLDIGVQLVKQRPDCNGEWTGVFAFEFLGENVNMSPEFVRFEVHRYLGWPGQAPSYKVGQRIWEQLRDEARRREGDAFDIRAFHSRALDLGGVGLDTLRSALLG